MDANIAFTGMILAWSVTEVIRYGYFVYTLGIGSQLPSWLIWLWYNTFFVLYLIGISSECALIWLAITPAHKNKDRGIEMLYKLVLAIYVPRSYIFVHAYDGTEEEGPQREGKEHVGARFYSPHCFD